MRGVHVRALHRARNVGKMGFYALAALNDGQFAVFDLGNPAFDGRAQFASERSGKR